MLGLLPKEILPPKSNRKGSVIIDTINKQCKMMCMSFCPVQLIENSGFGLEAKILEGKDT
jgi:hypothetical protein